MSRLRSPAPNSPATVAENPEPTELAKLRVVALHKRREIGKAKREGKGFVPVTAATLAWLLARLNTVRPMRAILLYTRRRGRLMAAGMSYNLFFAVAAMLVAGFSILGLVVAGDIALQRVIVNGIDRQVPNLIDIGDTGSGLATPEELFNAGGSLSIALIISTVITLYTALRWISSLRQGMRGIFDLPPIETNLVLAKVKDLGTLALLAVAMVVTFGIGFVANTLIDTVSGMLGLGAVGSFFTQVAGFVIMLILDMVVAVVLFRLASGIRMPRMAMFQAVLVAGVGSTILRTFSTQLLGLLGSADSNILLASFAVIPGLFIWFFLLSQVYLIATAWGAIRTADARAAHASHGVDRKRPSLRQRAREAHKGAQKS